MALTDNFFQILMNSPYLFNNVSIYISVGTKLGILMTTKQAEKFGNSFVLESKLSEEVKKDITQAVSACSHVMFFYRSLAFDT